MIKSICASLIFISIAYSQTSVLNVNSFDDSPIVYEKAGSGEQALVFVHCWSCDKSYWANQLEYFGDKYTVIAIDIAGHGESGLDRDDWTIENYGKDVKAVIEKENLSNVILIGHSMGGPVVLSAAEQLGNKVKALITIDTFQDIEQQFNQEQFDSFYKQFDDDFPGMTKQFVRMLFGENADSVLVERIADEMSSEPKEIALASFNSLFHFTESENFDKVDLPVRFINSDKFPTNTEAAKRHIKDFDIKIIKGVGHFPMLEKPEEFNSVLEEMIEDLKN
jgi:pimeloyl-ACP methyl ester carboxylesterase